MLASDGFLPRLPAARSGRADCGGPRTLARSRRPYYPTARCLAACPRVGSTWRSPASASANCSIVSTSTSTGTDAGAARRAAATAAAIEWPDAAGPPRRQVVVFNQTAVGQAHAVVCAAAGADGVLFQPPPTGERFAGIEDDGLRAGHRVDELSRQGGDAAQVHQEVESRPLAGQQRPQRPRDRRDDRAARQTGPVLWRAFHVTAGSSRS